MNMPGTDRPFIVIGENIHTTRVLLRKGKLVGDVAVRHAAPPPLRGRV